MSLVVAVAVVAVAGNVVRFLDRPRFTAQDVRASASSPVPPAFLPLPELDRLIGEFERRVEDGGTTLDLGFLGALYLDRARATGDIADHERAERALTSALDRHPGDVAAAILLAGARQSRHDFTGALDIAGKVLRADPGHLGANAAAGDAHLALGDHAAAARSFAALEAAAPDNPSVLVRRAEVARIEGDNDEALRLAGRAAETVPLHRRREAGFYRAFAAQLAFDVGDLAVADEQAAAAVDLDPHSPAALAVLARTRAAGGAWREAIGLYEEATAAVPHPTYLGELGDLYTLTGDEERAAAAYDTVAVIARLSPTIYDRQLARFYADHDIEAAAAVKITSAMLAVRHDVDGYDAHAWALYRAGDLAPARAASDLALALGTRSAPMLYHAGLISAALGDTARAADELAAALAINPGFSPLQAVEARRVLEEMGGAS